HCGHEHGHHEMSHGAGPAAAAAEFIDPVCGMTVKPDSPHQAEHDGKTWYFCSARCRARFVENPAAFLSPKPVDPEAAANDDREYSCPMHPEVRQIGPGICPDCGMALEPMMPSAEEEENPELTDFRRRFWWTLPFTLVLFVIAMSGGAFDGLFGGARAWVELALATPVVVWAGAPFFERWLSSLRTRKPNMWTLIGTGTGAA